MVSFNPNPIQQNIEIDTVQSGTSVASSTSAPSQPIEFTSQEPVVIEDEAFRAVMRFIGLNPDNPEDILTWNNKTDAEKSAAVEQYQQSQQTQTVTIEPLEEEPVEEPEASHESIQLPENWDKMSISNKQKFIKNLLGKEIYGDEWDKFSLIKKNSKIKDVFEEMLIASDPQYKKYKNAQDKQDALNRFVDTLSYVLENFDSNEEITPEKILNAIEDFNNKSIEDQNELLQGIAEKEEAEESETKTIRNNTIQDMQEYYGKDISEITTQEKIDYIQHLQEQGVEINEADDMIAALSKQKEYEDELLQYYEVESLSDIDDDDIINFLQYKINTTDDENIKDDLQYKIDLLQLKQVLKEHFHTDNLNEISQVQIRKFLSGPVITTMCSTNRAVQDVLSMASHNHDAYSELTTSQVLNQDQTKLGHAQDKLSQRIMRSKGISEDEITYNDIVEAISQLESNGMKIANGSPLAIIKAEAQIRQRLGQGDAKVKAQPKPNTKPSKYPPSISGLIGTEIHIDPTSGLIDIRKNENCQKFNEALNKFNDWDEFYAWYASLSGNEQSLVRSMLGSKKTGLTQELVDKLGLGQLGFDLAISGLVNEENGIDTNMIAVAAGLDFSTPEQQDAYFNEANTIYNQEDLAELYNCINSTGNTDLINLFNNHLSQRDDYNDIINLASSYAQNNGSGAASESGSRPSNGSSNGTSSVSTTYTNNYVTDPIVQNTPTFTSPETQSVYQQLISGEVSISQASEEFNKLSPDEKKAILEALPTSELVKMSVSICAICPEFVPKFVAAHKGIEIIKTVPDAASQAIRCMKKSNDNKVKEQLNIFMLENPALFMKISVEAARKSLSNESNRPVRSNFSNDTVPPRILGRA